MTARNRPKGPEGVARRIGPLQHEAKPCLCLSCFSLQLCAGPPASRFVTHLLWLWPLVSAPWLARNF